MHQYLHDAVIDFDDDIILTQFIRMFSKRFFFEKKLEKIYIANVF